MRVFVINIETACNRLPLTAWAREPIIFENFNSNLAQSQLNVPTMTEVR